MLNGLRGKEIFMGPLRLGLQIFAVFLAILGFVSKGETRRVNVSIPTRGMPVIAFAAGVEKGYYREEGLDVQLILMSAGVGTRARSRWSSRRSASAPTSSRPASPRPRR